MDEERFDMLDDIREDPSMAEDVLGLFRLSAG